jgi:D-tyrosyl-tRNA(Tyr) deacylase
MRLVLQRVKQAEVVVDGKNVSAIDKGLLILTGIGKEDNEENAKYLAKKVVSLRIFDDKAGKMNLSLKEIEGEILVVSQFTLYGDCRKGRRPSFDKAAEPKKALALFNCFVNELKASGLVVKTGVFGARMAVSLVNDGPVTFILEGGKKHGCSQKEDIAFKEAKEASSLA